jgi:hypothetical protein
VDYQTFLASKRKVAEPVGFDPVLPLNADLFPFQRTVAEWTIRRGRSAVWADCGLGKTAIELEWAHHVVHHTQRDCLIVAPLAVGYQVAREGEKFDVPVTVCKTADDVRPGVNVTNYDRLHHFDPKRFGSIVLNEASILKSFDGAMRKQITAFASTIPYRLSETATPAPNDLIELTNQAEFLDVMTGKEIIALFFTQDGNTTQKWRLKGHARTPFYRWLATWAVALRKPSDLGFSDEGFIIPELHIHDVTVESKAPDGYLFPIAAKGLAGHRAASRASLEERCRAVADLVTSDREPWAVWCNLNDESTLLKKLIPDAVEVRGSDTADFKEAAMWGFTEGRIRVLVTKASIAGHGMNWQHCARTAICGSSYSYEDQYQLIRRFHRFGQTRPVHVYRVASEAEVEALDSVRAKERQAAELMDEIVNHMAGLSLGRSGRDEMDYSPAVEMAVPTWLGPVGA